MWQNKFVFQTVGNGDYLSIDISDENYGKIVYVSINDREGHGHIMANSFSELLKSWMDLGCPGAEGSQWIPFTKDKVNGIDSKCENAIKWKKLIGIE